MFRVYIFLTLAVLFWSGNFVFGRFVHDAIHPLELAYFRWFLVFVLLLPFFFLRFKKLWSALKKHFLILFVLGGLGIGGFNTFLFFGLQETTATNALLINSSIPILIVLLASVFFKESITLWQFLGIILSTIGVVFLLVQGDFSKIFYFQFNRGDLFIILSSFDWAFYSLFLRYRPKELSSFEFFSLMVVMGLLILTFVYFFMGHTLTLESFILEEKVYFALGFMVAFPSLLSYLFWNKAVEQVGANKAGQFTHLMPIFGSVLAYIILGEVLHMYHIYGAIFIGLGIYLSLFFRRKIA